MKNPKIASRRKPFHASGEMRFDPRLAASIALDDSEEPELAAEDGDSVPQPIEEWANDDDANQWLHEHRFDGGGRFDVN